MQWEGIQSTLMNHPLSIRNAGKDLRSIIRLHTFRLDTDPEPAMVSPSTYSRVYLCRRPQGSNFVIEPITCNDGGGGLSVVAQTSLRVSLLHIQNLGKVVSVDSWWLIVYKIQRYCNKAVLCFGWLYNGWSDVLCSVGFVTVFSVFTFQRHSSCKPLFIYVRPYIHTGKVVFS